MVGLGDWKLKNTTFLRKIKTPDWCMVWNVGICHAHALRHACGVCKIIYFLHVVKGENIVQTYLKKFYYSIDVSATTKSIVYQLFVDRLFVICLDIRQMSAFIILC